MTTTTTTPLYGHTYLTDTDIERIRALPVPEYLAESALEIAQETLVRMLQGTPEAEAHQGAVAMYARICAIAKVQTPVTEDDQREAA